MRFAFRYDWAKPILTAGGLGPNRSRLEVGEGHLHVRMGWAFRMDAPLDSITHASLIEETAGRILWGTGVHGLRGHWRVNGATSPIVRVRFDPRQRAWTAGIPLRIHTLDVSPAEPELFLAKLGFA